MFFIPEWNIVIHKDVTFSVNAMTYGASQVWIIFFTKQGIMTFIQNNKCNTIKYTPYMKYTQS